MNADDGLHRDAGDDEEPGADHDHIPGGGPTTVEPIELHRLRVGVRHASLEHAPYRLLVGHFQGLPFSGAEAQLNRRSDGRLERLLLTQQYPQRLGEIAVLEPVDEAPPQGAIILGLGPTGELARVQLRDIVARALLRVAMNELDRRLATAPARGEPWSPLGVSSVLVGSSPNGGLPVETSVRALIDGTVAANARLTRLRVEDQGAERVATEVVAFEALELIERYEDRVDLIVDVLARLQAEAGDPRGTAEGARQPCQYVLRPARGEGRTSALSPIDAADEVWRRVDIRATAADSTGAVEFEFTSVGRLARAERLVGRAERAILDPLLANAIDNHADPDISGTLYELLVPPQLKGELGAGEHLHLLVDENTALYPWELMRPRPNEQEQAIPLALRVGVLRQFREGGETVRFDVRRASGRSALVIGNPPSAPAAQLPGAMDESIAVATKLHESDWSVSALIWDAVGNSVAPPYADPAGDGPVSPVRGLHQLLNGDWRVVHIAAHGQLGGDPTTTGVVLGDLHLTANVFSKMSVVPDLVVLNACHVGRVLTGANLVAASVGRALLQLGVRAVVVAGWAVDDTAARSFADALYGGLLAGSPFGRAVSLARHAAWKARPSSLTWGAYQCYGDPGFSLAPRSRRLERRAVHTVGELRRRIQHVRSRAGDQGRSADTDRRRSVRELRAEVEQLHREAVALGSAEALAELADTWGELMDLRPAIRLYRQALAGAGSNVPVRAIEQLGNLLSRRARGLDRRGVARARVDLYVGRAEAWLDRALALGRTPERLALLGGLHKRMAAMTDGDAAADHLRRAIRYYGEAQCLEPDAYYELNQIQLGHVARLRGIDGVPSAGGTPRGGGGTGAVAPPGERKPDAAPDFWTRAAIGDRLLTDLLSAAAAGAGAAAPAGDPAAPPAVADPDDGEGGRVPACVAAYEAAFRLRSSARERDSVVSHLRDLIDLLPDGAEVRTSLQQACDALAGWSGPGGVPEPAGRPPISVDSIGST